MIYTRSPHQQFTLKVGSAPLANVQFAGPWEAYGVVISNHTNQYLYLLDVNYYVPPGVVGATVPLPGLMQASASFTTPPGTISNPLIAGQTALLDYFAEELTPYPGVPTALSVSGTITNTNQDSAYGSVAGVAPTLTLMNGGTDGLRTRALLLGADGRLTPGLDELMLRELTMVRQGIGALLREFSGGGAEIANLSEQESI